ncbi:MAG: hypothetical protein R3293_26845 [Candidatus Promineifilaceae bacterium]|nr:hypothetical protein [Candidatus Promineifilaceae bacterium]
MKIIQRPGVLVPLSLLLAFAIIRATTTLAADSGFRHTPSGPGYGREVVTQLQREVSPEIIILPSSLSGSQAPDTIVSHTLTISNVGDADLNWTVIEQATPGARNDSLAERTKESLVSGLLYNNGPLINSPGTGVGGADESILQDLTLGMNSRGFGNQLALNNRIADNFSVPDGKNWLVDEILFYGYQVNSPITSTFTEINYRIWDGVPGDPGSSIVFGDTTTNQLSQTIWSGVYRVKESTSGTSAARPVMANTVNGGVNLSPGMYWLDWQADVIFNPVVSGPWAPPIAISGTITTGNGLQSFDNGVNWEPVLDSGTSTAQGFPFVITGQATCIPSEISWTLVSPQNGSTQPGSATVLTVAFDSTGLSDGIYQGTLCIETNDSSNQVVDLPITMMVSQEKNFPNYLPTVIRSGS